MSAFLGPIHIKMYDRILYQDSMSQKIMDLAAEKNWGDDFVKEVNTKAPAASRQPLESIVDEGNIHGWLSEAVDRCERRFALTVCSVLKDHPERLGELLGVMKSMGKEYALPPSLDVETAHQAIHDVLLDGMPCDFPFSNVEYSPDTVKWQVSNCLHKSYWTETRCDTEIYYQLRDAWVDGALGNSRVTHQRIAPYNHIMKKEQRNG